MSDIRVTTQFPTWMSGSGRRIGHAQTALDMVFDVLSLDTAFLFDLIAEFCQTDPASWIGTEIPAVAFLSHYPAQMRVRPEETAAQCVQRLLCLERLRGQENISSLLTLPWVISSALGRASEVEPTFTNNTLVGAYYFPDTETISISTGYSRTDEALTPLRLRTGSIDTLTGDGILIARPAGSVYGGGGPIVHSKFSPFGRSGAPSVLAGTQTQAVPTDENWNPLGPIGETSRALYSRDDAAVTIVNNLSGVSRSSSGTFRCLNSLLQDTGALTSTSLAKVKTAKDACLRGDSTQRVPGNAVPSLSSPRALKSVRSWNNAAGVSGGTVPLDLDDADTRFDFTAGVTIYGAGSTVPALTAQDHPLASDF